MNLYFYIVILMWAGASARSTDDQVGLLPQPPYTNGLGMCFSPMPGTHAQFSIYQTRVKDYRAFIRETGYIHMRETADPNSRMLSLDKDGGKQRGHSWEDPGFVQGEDNPVVGVSWRDAKAFCEWLTLRERAAGRLPTNREYRLPADQEWSVAVGLDENPALTPRAKDGVIADKYPWGDWPEGKPPPEGAGNYAGSEADDGHWPARFPTIDGYRDPFARTAPVGSFKPSRNGIYDLGGNVWEWCEDAYDAAGKTRVLRGASWGNYSRDDLMSSNRYNAQPDFRDDNIGFRCVVGPASP